METHPTNIDILIKSIDMGYPYFVATTLLECSGQLRCYGSTCPEGSKGAGLENHLYKGKHLWAAQWVFFEALCTVIQLSKLVSHA